MPTDHCWGLWAWRLPELVTNVNRKSGVVVEVEAFELVIAEYEKNISFEIRNLLAKYTESFVRSRRL